MVWRGWGSGATLCFIAYILHIWKRDYGHVKVSHPAEDICTLCIQFINRHKYSTGMSADSLADCSLFIDTSKQGEEEYGEEDEDEFESERESNQQTKPEVDNPLRRSPRMKGS